MAKDTNAITDLRDKVFLWRTTASNYKRWFRQTFYSDMENRMRIRAFLQKHPEFKDSELTKDIDVLYTQIESETHKKEVLRNFGVQKCDWPADVVRDLDVTVVPT